MKPGKAIVIIGLILHAEILALQKKKICELNHNTLPPLLETGNTGSRNSRSQLMQKILKMVDFLLFQKTYIRKPLINSSTNLNWEQIN